MWITGMVLGLTAIAGEVATELPRSGAELEVLCTNVWGLAWPLSRDRSARLPRITEEQDFSRYDLVAVQELWRGARRRVEGPWYQAQQAGDSGLALAGRLAGQAQLSMEPFRRSVGVERLKRKGILVADVEIDGMAGPLRVFVTHLQAGAGFADVRAAQASQLTDLLGEHEGPVLVLGDFNLHAGSPVDVQTEAVLRDAGLRDVALALGSVEATYVATNPYAWPAAHGERFDRVYLRDGGGVVLTPVEVEVLHSEHPLSDHQPLRVLLRVEGG